MSIQKGQQQLKWEGVWVGREGSGRGKCGITSEERMWMAVYVSVVNLRVFLKNPSFEQIDKAQCLRP